MNTKQHRHQHNGFEYCEDYANCTLCHCHLQDERHTICCKLGEFPLPAVPIDRSQSAVIGFMRTSHVPHSWTEESRGEWFLRCDRCRRWRIHFAYHEFYDDHGWWWECVLCTVKTLGDKLEKL